MQAIRRKIWLVVVLLIAAIAVSVVIYLNGGFSIAEYQAGYCGTIDGPTEHLNDTAKQGKLLFQANCASCHAMNKDLTGPALAGVMERLPSKQLMQDILWYPDKTFKKNKYARAVYTKYKLGHTDFREVLTTEDIEALIAYFKVYKSGYPYPEVMAD